MLVFTCSETDTFFNQKRFGALCQELVAELGYVRPPDPYEYLKDYLKDAESPAVVHFQKLAKEQMESVGLANHCDAFADTVWLFLLQNDPKRPALEEYFQVHDVHPFLQRLAEKIIIDGEPVNALLPQP